MACTVFGEQNAEFRKTEAAIVDKHPAMIEYKLEARRRWLNMFGGCDDLEALLADKDSAK